MKILPVPLSKKEQSLGWGWWVFQLLFLPLLLSEGNRYLGAPLSGAELNFLFFCLNFVGSTLILGRFALASCACGLRQIFRTLQSAFLGFALNGLAGAVLRFVTGSLFPDYVNQNDASILQMLQDAPLLIRIGTVILAPVAEELLFRGVIFGSLHSRSRILAYTVSILLFSLVHILGTVQQPVTFLISFIQYLPAGLSLAWAYERSGSILAPLLIHIAVNQMGISMIR